MKELLTLRRSKDKSQNFQTKDSHRLGTVSIEFPDPFKPIRIVEVKKGEKVKALNQNAKKADKL